jgi:Cu/Ag efflux protein CusF
MEFSVQDEKLLEGLKAGDSVQGKLKKTETGMSITQLEKR